MRIRSSLLVSALLLSAVVLDLSASDPPPAFQEGSELFEAGDYDAAADFFAPLGGAEKPWADYFLGRVEFERENWDGAIERLSAAVEAEPGSALFHRWLGHAFVEKINVVNAFKKMGVAKNARTHFEEAVRLAPDDLEARDAWVGYLTNAPAIAGGSREEAEKQVAELTALSPGKGAVLRGRMHFNEEEWKEAEAAYGKAIESDSGVAEYHYNLGFSRQQQENYGGAAEGFEQALVVDSEFLAALYQLGRSAALSRENTARGIEALTTYLDRPFKRGQVPHEHAHWRLGMVHEHRGEKELALAAYRAALAIDPKHEQAEKALKELE